ncbi:MAG TPA: pseudouridine synthase [Anaerolineales bacterium]|nr:pseudouridine synthase [Anaerolineales bacterium]HRQ91314.1 pseudouridine synthase [Anaerolineales bacterium]
MAEERLQKILARAGYGSRRTAEEMIEAGRVTVNGATAHIGDKADASRDAIKVDGSRISAAARPVYYAVYKPRGVLSTTGGPEPRQKVVDLIPGGEQLHLVGRLDKESEGLMILTNDGELTQRVSHPRFEQEKEYRVLVARQPDAEQLATWRRGVVLEDGTRTRPAEVRIEHNYGKGAWLRVIMHEGHKRQIREIAGQLGLPVVKLIRVRIGNLYLGSLKTGEWRALNENEVRDLMAGEKPDTRKPRPAAKSDEAPRKTSAPRRKQGKGPGSRKPAVRKPGIALGRPRRESAAGEDRGNDTPSRRPSGRPSSRPSGGKPSSRPSGKPSSRPSGGKPNSRPSSKPSSRPSGGKPSTRPSSKPSSRPSGRPSSRPAGKPSSRPAGRPARSSSKPSGNRRPR